MTGLELFLASTTLAASGLYLYEWHFRRAWEHLAISNGERLENSIRTTDVALARVDRLRSALKMRKENASRLADLSRGIDPRRDALWRES